MDAMSNEVQTKLNCLIGMFVNPSVVAHALLRIVVVHWELISANFLVQLPLIKYVAVTFSSPENDKDNAKKT